MVIQLFPESGFDQSAATPVLLGVLISWAFTETFGWVFAGLVVPGYLATAFVLDPKAATIDVGEAVITYGIARLLGEYLSRTGLTSRVFGRERFLLVLVVSVLVRLGVEGFLFTRFIPHATWAHSVGLVVVPLAANACWKTGLARGAVQNGVPTAIVYLVLRYVLIPHTNLSLAGFQLQNENVAASFLASPKAYILLLTSAGLAAIANVRYGWDYNGILLPALLAFVVPHPVKLAATIVEVLLVVQVAKTLTARTPLGRWNLEGPRRPVFFFVIDYVLRFAFAAVVSGKLPGRDVVELTGFGYLLPTLLAVKAWQKGVTSLVLVPTLGVSGAGYALASTLGFCLHLVDEPLFADPAPVTRAVANAPRNPVDAILWLSALARSSAPPRGGEPTELAAALARVALAAGKPTRGPLPPWAGEEIDDGCVVFRERFQDADRRLGLPSVVIRKGPTSKTGRTVAFVAEPLMSPETAELAGMLFRAGSVDAVVIAGTDEGASRSGAVARLLARALADGGESPAPHVGVVIGVRMSGSNETRVRLSERASTDTRVARVLSSLGGAVATSPSPRPSQEDVSLEVPPASQEAERAESISIGTSTALALALDDLQPCATRPPIEDVLALARLVIDPLLGSRDRPASLPLVRRAAHLLGYELRGPGRLPDGEAGLVLLPHDAPRDVGIVVRQNAKGGPIVEIPRGIRDMPRRAALRLADALHFDAVIVGLDDREGAVDNPVFAEAHAAATFPRAGRDASVVSIREADVEGETGALASLSTWNTPESGESVAKVESALGRFGIQVTRAPLDLQTRERAGRTAFGSMSLVAVTLDPRLRRSGPFAMRPEAVTDWSFVEAEDNSCAAVASQLGVSLGTGSAPGGALFIARAAAVERSVVARRELARLISETPTRARRVRAPNGVFLVVVARTAEAVVAGAFPLGLAPDSLASSNIVAQSLDACGVSLDAGGTCRVEAPP